MAQPKIKATASTAKEERATSLCLIAASNGTDYLIHPFTQKVFTPEPVEAEVDGWVQVQINAGKLAKCHS